jgi:hypothetical protein
MMDTDYNFGYYLCHTSICSRLYTKKLNAAILTVSDILHYAVTKMHAMFLVVELELFTS